MITPELYKTITESFSEILCHDFPNVFVASHPYPYSGIALKVKFPANGFTDHMSIINDIVYGSLKPTLESVGQHT